MPGGDPPAVGRAEPRVPAVRRVLMTADAVGGVWPYSLDLASALHRRGVEVTIAVSGPAPGDAQRSAAVGIARLAVGDYRLEWMDEPWEDVQRAGRWLLDLERAFRPDVVHLNGYCHAPLPWRAPAVVVAHSCVCSWWRSVHGIEAPGPADRYRREVSRGLARARLVVAPTAAMLAALRREYHELPEARVIPNGRPVRNGNHKEALKESFVFAAGRLWDEAKNIETLCGVAPSLSWPVYVAGSDAAPDGRRAPVRNVRHLGRLEPAEMDEWFARAAIYALPARYEPFGLSVLDAALAGCALVLGDIPSLRENWSGAAVFVPADNRRALSAALQRLIENRHERTRLAALARERAQQFDVQTMAERYLTAYHDVRGADIRGSDLDSVDFSRLGVRPRSSAGERREWFGTPARVTT